MLIGLYNRVRRTLLHSRRRASAEGGASSQWLAGVFHQPRASSLVVAGPHQLAYRLYLPAGIVNTKRLPLLVMLHGCRQTAVEFAEATRMNAAAGDRYCAVLYPEQSKKFNSLRCWNWFEPKSLVGDGEAALIVRTMLHVMENYPIDAARVYVAGLSAGGAMAAVLCATSGRNLFAACAIHSGVMFHAATTSLQAIQVMRRGSNASLDQITQQIASHLPPGSRLVPTLIIHGTDDQTVNPVNAEQMIEQTRLLAQRLHPQSAAPTMRDEQWIESGGRRYRQQDMSFGSMVLLRGILIDGLGHAWSGGDARYMFSDPAGPDASRLILEFLLSHQLPADISAGAVAVSPAV
ncbi:MAG TPA: PHB depolymerase family esterase [Steroidobacteraceae bacterium]